MGSIIQNAANNVGANGIFSSSALNNSSLSGISALPSGVAGDLKLLTTATASASASLSFNSTYINSSYKIFKFEWINTAPSTGADMTVNFSTDNGSNYNVTKTTTLFTTTHYTNDSFTELGYNTGRDLAQSTAELQLEANIGTQSDMGVSGHLYLFNPSSTTYVKHLISRNNLAHQTYTTNWFVAGYCNTTSAINAVRFKYTSGNVQVGTFKLYGIGAN